VKTMKIKIPLKQYIVLLRSYLRTQKRAIVWLAILLVSGTVLQLVNPQIIRYFIDTSQQSGSIEMLLYAAMLFIGVSLLNQGVQVVATYIGENVGWTATNQLRVDVAAHSLSLDMSFHKDRTSGENVERVDGDINALANFFSSFVIVLLSNLLLMVGIIVLLFRESMLVGSAMLVFIIAALVVIQYIRKFAVPSWAALRQMNAQFFGFLVEHLEGTEDTRANGATGFVLRQYYLLLRKWLPIRLRAFLGWAAMWITTIIVFSLGTAVAFGVSAYLWRQGAVTIGTVYMIFHYTELLAKPIEKLRMQIEDLQKADASIHRVQELLDLRSSIQDGVGTPLLEGSLSVTFQQVSFGYEKGLITLNNINFHLESGRVLGVIGRTGSGKTTLTRLLMRFYNPDEGRILLGGVDIRDPYVHEVRKRVGLVTQSIEIFQGTVRDNLTFFDNTIEDLHIIEVLHELGLESWYTALPSGLDSLLDSGGGGLSAGEAQLLAFARVFLTDPGLIILDEASSRLDPASEQLMERAMNRLLHNRTCIIIAHRLSTLQRAYQILMLEDGEVVEYGTRTELINNTSSRFSQVLATGLEEVLA
jgi:ATP-binding cassette subfamily B protein